MTPLFAQRDAHKVRWTPIITAKRRLRHRALVPWWSPGATAHEAQNADSRYNAAAELATY